MHQAKTFNTYVSHTRPTSLSIKVNTATIGQILNHRVPEESTKYIFEMYLQPCHIYIFRNLINRLVTHRVSAYLEVCQLKECELIACVKIFQENYRFKAFFYSAEEILALLKLQFGPQRFLSTGTTYCKEPLYHVVPTRANLKPGTSGFILANNQTLKLGYMIFDVSTSKKNPKARQIVAKMAQKVEKINYEKLQEKPICRYCLEFEGEGFSDFFASLCKCKGTASQVHFQCLRKWHSLKVIKYQLTQAITKYANTRPSCQICKQKLPKYAFYDGINCALVGQGQKQRGTVLKLDLISTQSSGDVFIIKDIPALGIQIGRNEQSIIRYQQINLSRSHSLITMEGGQPRIYDMQSATGTLIGEYQRQVELSEQPKVAQVSYSIIQIMVKP